MKVNGLDKHHPTHLSFYLVFNSNQNQKLLKSLKTLQGLKSFKAAGFGRIPKPDFH